ncbi:hypothetical protein FVF58_37885 [Paraburkholderia panacisoli]|uniref:Uncharacterized protein n=1 Tax=Paraburkholderia panacisoli TaxID=2603818 RepID=A0A5B0GGJ7_9BURK|nr:hypothetical protein [Paraburkholderia panacisoli]KAA1002517.1 hypothetical protein FVF58_37885 [Paraburkholderia panacisoli]
MKIVTGSIAMSMSALVVALMLGAAGPADAQLFNNAGGGMSGAQPVGSNSAGATAGAGVGAGSGTGLTTGVGTSAGVAGSTGVGQPLNTMRANGTALYMNPDPRAPNVSGRAAPLR